MSDEGSAYKLHLGDCLEVMKTMESNSVDSICCDPPYGLAFMGAEFDTFHKGGVSDNVAFQQTMTPIFAEALRVAKPGAYLLAFGGTRTYHRLACAIEDAGWEIKDQIDWIYAQGFPKGMDVSKAIDKQLGASREKKTIVCGKTSFGLINDDGFKPHRDVAGDEAVTEEAKEWQGWNTQLKPALEPIVVARKPLEGTVADNVMKYGTGAMNIDGCRIPTDENITNHSRSEEAAKSKGMYGDSKAQETHQTAGQKLGRFPANLIHDGSDEVLAIFPENKGAFAPSRGASGNNGIYGRFGISATTRSVKDELGSAARFFYCAKASRAERGKGNSHITVKPIALMQWLVRLVTRKGGMVLDPFMGSGTTGIAAIKEGMNFTGIEISEEYYNIAKKRIEEESAKPVYEELF